MISINTDLSSLMVQKNLNNSTNKLNQAIERMSSGYKINHASDNAANYSISTNLTTQLGAYLVAEENISMGLDMVTTASDSLSLINDHAKRLRDLCMHVQNGTYGIQSVNAIQNEVNARISEIEQIYNTAEYNGINLLNNTANMIIPESDSDSGLEHDITPKETGFINDIVVVTPDVIVTDPTQLASAIANNTKIGISNAETLAKLAELVNNGTSCSGKTIILTEDIDLSAYSTGEGWTPIGTLGNKFEGKFNGQGHKVRNLYINRPDNNYQGLFGYASGSTFKNVGIENCNVTGYLDTGSLVGHIYDCQFTNCYTTGNVTGRVDIGGLVGYVDTKCNFTGCYVMGDVKGYNYVGALLGIAVNCKITNCFATGKILPDGGCYSSDTFGHIAGGLIGGGYGNTITNSKHLGSELKTNNYQITDEDTGYCATSLNIGINGDDSCQITFDTNFSYDLIYSLESLDVTDSSSLEVIDNFLSKISEKQTELGSAQNRLESALESTSVSIENLTKTRSTIKDANIDEVSSDFIRHQILKQASTTLLATANQPSGVALTLLNGLHKERHTEVMKEPKYPDDWLCFGLTNVTFVE